MISVVTRLHTVLDGNICLKNTHVYLGASDWELTGHIQATRNTQFAYLDSYKILEDENYKSSNHEWLAIIATCHPRTWLNMV